MGRAHAAARRVRGSVGPHQSADAVGAARAPDTKTQETKSKEEVPQTPVQGSGAHEPLLSRDATSHSLTAMLAPRCRLKMWTERTWS